MRRSEENGSRFWWTGSVVQTLKGELVEGTVVAIVVWMMWGVVWYGKWKGGLAKCVDKAVGERMVGGR